MASNYSNDYTQQFVRHAPFNVHVPSSLRDPSGDTFSVEDLESLNSMDATRNLALTYLHDDKKFASLWNSSTVHPRTRRWMRKFIQIQTINAVLNGFYRLSNATRVDLDIGRMIHAALNTKQYDDYYDYDTARQQRSYPQPAEISVVNGDCLDTVLSLKRKYPDCNPVVLNMANAYSPGGGWHDGCGAQEENLHRRTNLFQCLEDPYHQFDSKRPWKYPISEFGGLYSPNVSVFRGSESQGYPFFSDGPKYVSFIACAAYSNPPTWRNEYGELELFGDDIVRYTTRKIETILRIALDNEHDTVILSAFGCGAFRNPPRHIAKLFQQVISSEFPRAFKHIVFAIIDDHNASKDHNPDGNVAPFADIFNLPVLTIAELESATF